MTRRRGTNFPEAGLSAPSLVHSSCPTAPGETTMTITIAVNGDSKKEADENFFLDLTGLSSNGLFTKSRGIGTILNDD